MKIEGMDFLESLRFLADKAGVKISSEDYKTKSEREVLLQINEEAVKFFQDQLKNNSQVNNYLNKRGLRPETISEFRIGFAKDEWRSLADHLRLKGYKDEEVEKAGLIIKKEKNLPPTTYNLQPSYYDRFRNRIMFPILDINSKVVGFTGRIFGEGLDQGGKYVNTPETLIFKKGYLLFGLDKARFEIKKLDYCLLVEGQMDLIMSHQAGAKNTVATSGTALTNQQLSIIKRYTDNLVFAYDSDEAGILAINRGIDLALAAGFNVKIILTEAKDPADFIVEKGDQAWLAMIKEAKSIMEHHFATVLKKNDVSNLEGKKKAANLLLKEIKKIPNNIEMAHWLAELSLKLGISEEHLINELKNIKNEQSYNANMTVVAQDIKTKNRKELLSERLLYLLIKDPTQISLIHQHHFLSEAEHQPRLYLVFEAIINLKDETSAISSLKEKLSEDLNKYLDYLFLENESAGHEIEDINKEIKICLRDLKTQFLRDNLNQLSLDMKQSESTNEIDVSLIDRFHFLSKELTRVLNEKY
ncbi:DNA primase [Candidatus Azambacteria bacterium]|nr:DNA primase [Candidatus Azambacteria bacterium]